MKLYKDVINLILDFIPKYKLRDWIDEKELYPSQLSFNPLAVDFLEEHPNMICWIGICMNESPDIVRLLRRNVSLLEWDMISAYSRSIEFLEENIDKLCWRSLSANPVAVPLLKRCIEDGGNREINKYCLSCNSGAGSILKNNPKYISWEGLSTNQSPEIVPLLEANLDKVNWNNISANPSPGVVSIIKKEIEQDGYRVSLYRLSGNPSFEVMSIIESNIDKNDSIDWYDLSKNPKAVHILRNNIDKIDWDSLCENESPEAIDLLQEYPENINWDKLSGNCYGIPILEKNFDKIEYEGTLSSNPAIFIPYRNPKLFEILMEIEIH